MKAFRLLAWLYAVTVFLMAVCAWYVDISLRNSVREHLLPDILLMLMTYPASLSLEPLYENFPAFFSKPFIQITWLTMCGTGQASVLFVAQNLISRRQRSNSTTNSF